MLGMKEAYLSWYVILKALWAADPWYLEQIIVIPCNRLAPQDFGTSFGSAGFGLNAILKLSSH